MVWRLRGSSTGGPRHRRGVRLLAAQGVGVMLADLDEGRLQEVAARIEEADGRDPRDRRPGLA